MLQKEKVLLSAVSNEMIEMIDRVLEFIKKRAVANWKNIIRKDELCQKIKGVCSYLETRWKLNVVMRLHIRFLTKNKA